VSAQVSMNISAVTYTTPTAFPTAYPADTAAAPAAAAATGGQRMLVTRAAPPNRKPIADRYSPVSTITFVTYMGNSPFQQHYSLLEPPAVVSSQLRFSMAPSMLQLQRLGSPPSIW
jgi:hypothetical protein